MARAVRLTEEEERDLGRKARAGDESARETLVLRNLPLARKMVEKYTPTRVPLADLMSWGICGLVDAVNRWDPDHPSGARFATVANYWIRHYLNNECVPANEWIHISHDSMRLRYRVEKAAREGRPAPALTARQAAKVADAKAAWNMKRFSIEGANKPSDRIRDFWKSTLLANELFNKINNKLSVESGSTYPDGDAATLLAMLNAEEARVLKLRFGFTHDGQEFNYAQIGRRIGRTRETVRLIAEKALAKLRRRARVDAGVA